MVCGSAAPPAGLHPASTPQLRGAALPQRSQARSRAGGKAPRQREPTGTALPQPLHHQSPGSLQALCWQSRTIPTEKHSAKPFIPLSCSHRSPGRTPHERSPTPQREFTACHPGHTAAGRGEPSHRRWQRRLTSSPGPQLCLLQTQPRPIQHGAFKK